MHAAFRLWRPVPRSEDRPEDGGRRRSRSPHPLGCLWFSRPRRAHARFTFQCWRRRQDSNLHNPKVIAGFKPAQHTTCAPPKVAERRVLETHTVAGALRLAIACEPCPLCAPCSGPSGGLGAHNRSGKGRMLVTRLSFGGRVVPRGRFARPLPRYERGVPLSGLAGNGANPETRALFRRLQGGCITFNAWSAWSPRAESNSRSRPHGENRTPSSNVRSVAPVVHRRG